MISAKKASHASTKSLIHHRKLVEENEKTIGPVHGAWIMSEWSSRRLRTRALHTPQTPSQGQFKECVVYYCEVLWWHFSLKGALSNCVGSCAQSCALRVAAPRTDDKCSAQPVHAACVHQTTKAAGISRKPLATMSIVECQLHIIPCGKSLQSATFLLGIHISW